MEFTRSVIALRRDHPVFRRRKFFQGQAIHGSGVKDIGWFTPDGAEMTEALWQAPDISTLGVFLNGDEIPDQGPRGERIADDSFLLLLNGGAEPAMFTLPGRPWGKEYELVVDTSLAYVQPAGADAPTYMAGEELSMASRSLAVLRKRS
jgi:glycogen operon protein